MALQYMDSYLACSHNHYYRPVLVLLVNFVYQECLMFLV